VERDASQKSVTVVQSAGDERLDYHGCRALNVPLRSLGFLVVNNTTSLGYRGTAQPVINILTTVQTAAMGQILRYCHYSVNHSNQSNVHLVIALTAQSDTSNFPR